MELHVENCKSFAAIAVFLVAMIKVNLIDRKLRALEKQFKHK